MDLDDTNIPEDDTGKKKRLKRLDTPHKMAIYLERLVHEVRADDESTLVEKSGAITRLMRLLREIHADEVLAKRQDEQEQRLLRLQEKLEGYERRGMLQ
jgi:hypothetical protein